MIKRKNVPPFFTLTLCFLKFFHIYSPVCVSSILTTTVELLVCWFPLAFSPLNLLGLLPILAQGWGSPPLLTSSAPGSK